MYFKIEHVIVVLLLLPFGLRGVMTTPAIDNLLILGVLAILPALLIRLHERTKPTKIGKLAVKNQMLTKGEVSQILFCQKHSEEKFGEIAIRRDFLKVADLDALLMMQNA